MQCEWCGKNEAVIIIKQVSDNGTTSVHSICQNCTTEFNIDFSGNDNEGIAKIFKAIESKKFEAMNKITCPSCGTKLSDVLQYERIGCLYCVLYFRQSIEQGIKRTISSFRYTGAKPKEFNIINSPTEGQTLFNLRMQLQQAVEIENYELAAYLRDKISELDNGSGIQHRGITDALK